MALFIFLTVNTTFALGTVSEYMFFLDTSVQNYSVIVNKPTFPTGPDYNFNQFVDCKGNTGTEVDSETITGMGSAYYQCAPTSYLDLGPHSYYDLDIYFDIFADNQKVTIKYDYPYDPYGISSLQNPYMLTFLLYLDKDGVLSYRSI